MSRKCAYAPPSIVSTDDATCGTPMWMGRRFTCVCFRPKGSYQKMCINLTPPQEERLKRLKHRIKVYFDTSRSEHREALRALWYATFPGKELHNLVSEQWKEMGWQGRDPSTDFRGAGFISLENLLFFAKTFATSFQNLLKKQGGKRATWEYPFAVAGVNITFMIMQMLELHRILQQSPGLWLDQFSYKCCQRMSGPLTCFTVWLLWSWTNSGCREMQHIWSSMMY